MPCQSPPESLSEDTFSSQSHRSEYGISGDSLVTPNRERAGDPAILAAINVMGSASAFKDSEAASFRDRGATHSGFPDESAGEHDDYVATFGNDLYIYAQSLHPDAEEMEALHEALPELLRTFALRLGYRPPSRLYLNLKVFF